MLKRRQPQSSFTYLTSGTHFFNAMRWLTIDHEGLLVSVINCT